MGRESGELSGWVFLNGGRGGRDRRQGVGWRHGAGRDGKATAGEEGDEQGGGECGFGHDEEARPEG